MGRILSKEEWLRKVLNEYNTSEVAKSSIKEAVFNCRNYIKTISQCNMTLNFYKIELPDIKSMEKFSRDFYDMYNIIVLLKYLTNTFLGRMDKNKISLENITF